MTGLQDECAGLVGGLAVLDRLVKGEQGEGQGGEGGGLLPGHWALPATTHQVKGRRSISIERVVTQLYAI